MKVDVPGWLRANRSIYIGNATSVRDFRVQLRGNRSVVLFSLYLLILICASMITYSTASGGGNSSIVDAQFALRGFYASTMIMLGGAVCLIAPGLAATTVVIERQRQSLDLVFSAPVSPKYYLVGKMLSSFRYTWMILILALPITAAAVVLGGASWSDVLLAYVLLSLQGLVMTAIALLISTLAGKPVGAIVWSYIVAGFYAFITFAIAEDVLLSAHFFGGRSRDIGEESWLATLSPFNVMETSRTYTTLWGHHVPNWIIAGIVILLVVKLCLLGAGSILDRTSSREIAGLRIHALCYIAAVAVIVGFSWYPSLAARAGGVASGFSPGGGPTMAMTGGTVPSLAGTPPEEALNHVSSDLGEGVAIASAPLIIFLPFIACFGFDRERRYWPNGVLSLRRMFDGSPAGGLSFLMAFLLIAFIGCDVGVWLNDRVWLTSQFWLIAFYVAAFWFFFYAIGRLVSSFFGGLKAARMLLVTAYLLIVALPFPFLTFTSGLVTASESNRGAWDFYILSPISVPEVSRASQATVFGGILLVLGIVATIYSETRVKSRLATSRKYDERSLQTT